MHGARLRDCVEAELCVVHLCLISKDWMLLVCMVSPLHSCEKSFFVKR